MRKIETLSIAYELAPEDGVSVVDYGTGDGRKGLLVGDIAIRFTPGQWEKIQELADKLKPGIVPEEKAA